MCEKDLCVVVDHKLNLSQQCDVSARRVKAILGHINRSGENNVFNPTNSSAGEN